MTGGGVADRIEVVRERYPFPDHLSGTVAEKRSLPGVPTPARRGRAGHARRPTALRARRPYGTQHPTWAVRFAGVLQHSPPRWLQEKTAQANTFIRTTPAGGSETFDAVVRVNDSSNDDTFTGTYRFAPFDETFEVEFREPSR